MLTSKLSRGLKNTSFLAIGSIVSLLINTLGFIYIARVLGPSDYGIYTMVGVFVELFDILLLKGLNKTILREGSKDIASLHKYLEKTIGLRGLLIVLAMSICIAASFFTPYQLQTKIFIILCSAQLAYYGLNTFLQTIYQATEKMQYNSILTILNRVLFISLAIIFLYLGFGLLALFLISLFSQLITLLTNYQLSKKFVQFNIYSNIEIDKRILKPAIVFSLLLFVGFLTTKIDLLMISILGTARDVGIYGVAYTIINQGVIARNITSTGFFPVLTKHFHHNKIKGIILIKYSLLFLFLILSLSVFAFFYMEEMIGYLLGPKYAASANILKVLIFYLGIWWATMPFTLAAQSTHNEKMVLIGRSIMAVLNIPLNLIFFTLYGLIGIAYSTIIIYSVGGLLISILSYQAMKKQGYLI